MEACISTTERDNLVKGRTGEGQLSRRRDISIDYISDGQPRLFSRIASSDDARHIRVRGILGEIDRSRVEEHQDCIVVVGDSRINHCLAIRRIVEIEAIVTFAGPGVDKDHSDIYLRCGHCDLVGGIVVEDLLNLRAARERSVSESSERVNEILWWKL